jgi:hypothetical protein
MLETSDTIKLRILSPSLLSKEPVHHIVLRVLYGYEIWYLTIKEDCV